MKTVLFFLTLLLSTICQAQYSRIQDSVPLQRVEVSEGKTKVVMYLRKREDNQNRVETLRGAVQQAIKYCEDICKEDVLKLRDRIKMRSRALNFDVAEMDIEVRGKMYKAVRHPDVSVNKQ